MCLAEGDFSVTITATQRRDELNIVARAMEVFRPAGITRERAQAEQSEVVDQLSHALDQLAQQNLECRIEADVPVGYAKLRHDFKRAVEARSRAIGTVRIGAAGVMAAIITQVAEMSLPLRQPAPSHRVALF